MMKNILLTGAFNYSDDQLKQIKKLGYNITFVQDELIELQINVEDFHVVVCNALFLSNDISNFKNLETIQLTSAGLDRVPIEYIKKNGIKIFNAKDVYSIPMAEWAILKILEIYKKSKFFFENQNKQIWVKNREIFELNNKIVGIVGFGSIGKEVAKRLKVFGTYIIAIDLNDQESNLVDEVINITRLDEILNKLDVLILTVPLTESTHYLIDSNRLELMKKDSVIVNISRGEVINEIDLIKKLKEDKFIGVALDVFENEPLEESELWNLEKIIITPHNSFVSKNNAERLFKLIISNLNEGVSDE